MENSIKVEKVQEEVQEAVGEIRTIGSKEVGESPEEKAQKEEELNQEIQRKARFTVVKTFKTQLLQIREELNKGKTMDDILTEINEKKSRMSRTTRDLCLNFKPDAVVDLVKDLTDFENEKRGVLFKV